MRVPSDHTHGGTSRFDPRTCKPDPKMIKGRQVLRLIYDSLEVGHSEVIMEQVSDLLKIEIKNGDLKRFHDEWLYCLLHQIHPPSYGFKLTKYLVEKYIIEHLL